MGKELMVKAKSQQGAASAELEQVPPSIEEIAKRENNSEIRIALLAHAERNQTSENVQFLLAFLELEKILASVCKQSGRTIEVVEKETQSQQMFQEIYNKYICEGALQVNISHDFRETLKSENDGGFDKVIEIENEDNSCKSTFKLESFRMVYLEIRRITTVATLKSFGNSDLYRSTLALPQGGGADPASGRSAVAGGGATATSTASSSNFDARSRSRSNTRSPAPKPTTPSPLLPMESLNLHALESEEKLRTPPALLRFSNGSNQSYASTAATQPNTPRRLSEQKRQSIEVLLGTINTYLTAHKDYEQANSICCCFTKPDLDKRGIFSNLDGLKKYLTASVANWARVDLQVLARRVTEATDEHKELAQKREPKSEMIEPLETVLTTLKEAYLTSRP